MTIDTLRADHLGVYGAAHATPAIDGLAGRGLRFERAYAHAVMTLPSHASLLTGLAPPRHGARNNGHRLRDDVETVAERLQRRGYRTGAFVAAFVLDRRFGLAQGFETYDDAIPERHALDFRIGERPADAVLDAAARWLDAAPSGRPWFGWIHLFEPHTPYAPARRHTGDAYTDEVIEVDRILGAFLDAQRAAGRLERTVVVVTSDHGESLGEHGEATHGLFAYDATLRVPLVVAGPGIGRGAVDAPVSHADVAASLLALVGAGGEGLDGAPLHAALAGESPPRDTYFEALDAYLTRGGAPLTGVVSGRWKLIDLPLPELYDVEDDPAETSNVWRREPARARELAGMLTRWRQPESAAASVVDAQAAARLRSLGYAAGAEAPRAPTYAPADDPKTLLPVHQKFAAALERGEQGDLDSAVGSLREVIADRPTFAAAYTAAASLLIGGGRPRDAVSLLEAAHRNRVSTPEVDQRLGAALLAAGDAPAAARVLGRAAAASPDDPEALNLLAVAYMEAGRSDEARRLLSVALERAPGSAGIWTNLGLLELRAGRTAESSAAFRKAVEVDANAVEAWRGIGAALAGAGERRGAVDAWKRAVALDTSDAPTLFNLAVLLSEISPPDAVPHIDRYLTLRGTPAEDRARLTALRRQITRTEKAPGSHDGPRR